ncbi:MAG TPA: hypothetical protein VGU02_03540 [Gaiellaceae bacterium]|nr:hypothetical protein [Gaiellaceae bacterium]
MKARLAIAIGLGAALLAVPAALGSGSQSFADSVGEDAQAPDITSVNVSNDDSANLTFKVNISNRPAFTSDMLMFIFLNTDQNLATGDPQLSGADYVIQLEPGNVSLFQWSGRDYGPAQSQASLTYGYDATGATIHINANELGNTKNPGFVVLIESGVVADAQGNLDDTNAHFDVAPDPGHGMYSYKLLVKVSLKQTAFTTTPAKAGARFSASLAATESDTGAAVTTGAVTCKGVVGTTRVAATHSLRNGVATCSWKLPKAASKKLFHGTITLTSQGATLKKSFSARVR